MRLFFLLLAFLVTAAPLAADPPHQTPPRLSRPDAAQAAPPDSVPRLFFSGPSVFLILCSLLAGAGVTAVGAGRAERLARFGTGASDRLEGRPLLPMLWGLAAIVLATALVSALFAVKALAGLGLIAGLAALIMVALGLGVAALSLGRALLTGFDAAGVPDDTAALRFGLWALLLTSILPVVGWLVAGLAVASGLGAILEALLTRRG